MVNLLALDKGDIVIQKGGRKLKLLAKPRKIELGPEKNQVDIIVDFDGNEKTLSYKNGLGTHEKWENYNIVDIILSEEKQKAKNLVELGDMIHKTFEEIITHARNMEIKISEVEFIKDRKRTVLIVQVGNEKVLTRATYNGESKDEGFKNILGFLYAFYKFAHNHLNANQLKHKLDIVLSDKDTNYVEAYLTSFFVESGIVSPKRAIKIVNTIKAIDSKENRIKINL